MPQNSMIQAICGNHVSSIKKKTEWQGHINQDKCFTFTSSLDVLHPGPGRHLTMITSNKGIGSFTQKKKKNTLDSDPLQLLQ